MKLRREVGLFGAMMMGLGSIVGTGVFVSIGLGVNIAGSGVLLAIFLASIVAICNGLSSAQLAANHPVSGGTYEYGYRWLTPQIGFVAGWMFLCAKSASAAAAALGLASYLIQALPRVTPAIGWKSPWLVVPVALAAVFVLLGITLTGIRRSNIANTIIVSITLSSLAFFIVAGMLLTGSQSAVAGGQIVTGDWGIAELLQVTALMFVAYTGYGRIATLGEEIVNPRRNIPIAVIMTLAMSMILYLGVGSVVLKFGMDSGGNAIGRNGVVSLESIAAGFAIPGAGFIVFVGAMTALVGVLLNLLLGLSRVMLAMGRRGDMPAVTATITESTATPTVATIAVAAIICTMVAFGSVKLAWSFSAFTVLVYYAITNLCALRLKKEERLYSVAPAWIGLLACLFLAFWVDVEVWCFGLALIGVGLVWHWLMQRRSSSQETVSSK